MQKTLSIRPFVAARRPPAAVPPVAGIARRPFRLWMTGSIAVAMTAMAAMIPMRSIAETERLSTLRWLRHSRFDVSETLQRIERAAESRGLSVLARLPGDQAVLVFATSAGGTPAVMDAADSQPAMPFSLMVRAAPDGGADVLLAAARSVDAPCDWSELPASVVDDLRAWPGMVDRALV